MRPCAVPCLLFALIAAACVPGGDATASAGSTASASTTASTGDSSGSGHVSSGGTDDGTAADATGSPGSGSTSATSAGSTAASSDDDGSDTSAGTDGSVGGSTTDAPPPSCEGIGDCERCGAVEGCGWCGASGTCAPGDANGPAGGSCSGGWVLAGDFFSCPAANCFAQTNCADCQDFYSGCGWCAANGTCMPGAPDMPAPGGQCADQQWYFDICPEDCADEMTCISCTGTVGCGWCDASNTCMAGTDAGPLLQACGGGWSTSPDSCF
ncbi:MAG: hypothetical protein U0168_02845 [Nannocystaceae bacterium]